MVRYFLITGLDHGETMIPYVEKTDGDLPSVIVNGIYGDHVRYYEELTKTQYDDLKIKYIKKNVEHFKNQYTICQQEISLLMLATYYKKLLDKNIDYKLVCDIDDTSRFKTNFLLDNELPF